MTIDLVEYSVFDGDPANNISPQRPTIGNLGGAAFVNDPNLPPDPEICPDADGENQKENVIYGLAQMGFSLAVRVTFSTGAPVLYGFSTTGTRLVTGNITITDNAAGDTTIAWPADYLPPRATGPLLSLNEDVEIDRQRIILAGDGLSVTVKTKLGATGTDCGFTAFIP